MINKFEKNYLIGTILKLSKARDVATIIKIIRRAARILTGADGASFILKDNDKCFYVDEDAILPLWKGRRFPIETCISGWAMIHKESVLVKDIFEDSRIPLAAYLPTFVKSLVIVPINRDHPVGAIGNYWGHIYEATEEEISMLELIADCTAVALRNIETLNYLEKSLRSEKDMCDISDEYIEILTKELRSTKKIINNNLQASREWIKEKMDSMSASQDELKKSIYYVSLKQLSEMNKLFKDFLMKEEEFLY